MTNQPFPQDEHKFDTLSLLAGLKEEDIRNYSLDDILSEFTDKPTAQKPAEQKPAAQMQEEPQPAESSRAARKQARKAAKAEKRAKRNEGKIAAVPQEKPEELPDFLMGNLEEVGVSAPAAQEEAAVPAPTKSASEEPAAVLQTETQAAAEKAFSVEQKETEEPSFIDQIQLAIDRDLELNQATPEPVIRVEKEEDLSLGDPELDAIFKDKPVRSVEQLPPDPVAEEKPVLREEPKPETPAQDLKVVEPLEPVPSAAELYRKSAKSVRPLRMRLTAAVLLTLIAVILTAINQYGWSDAAAFVSNKITSKILLGVMVLCAALSADIIKNGVKSIFELRVTGESMMTLIFLVTAIDAILCGNEQPIPFCAVVCVQFCFAAWGKLLQRIGIRRALKPILKQEGKYRCISVVEDAWEGGKLAASVEDGSEEEHVRGLLKNNAVESRMRIYAPVAIVLTLVLAFLVRFKTGNSLTWSWSSMMIGALPVACFISFYRPFAILSARLMKQGAAVSGWTGAERLSGAQGIALQDEDIFPAGSVKINGMKVYGSYSIGQSVGYAAAVVEASGSGLTPLFRDLRSSNNGRFFTVSQFRRYDGGGFGAEIGGDVVLMGSLRFMQLMGVYMHEGTKVRNAIYLSVNGEMCAVFSLNYGAYAKVRRGLRQIVAAAGLMPVFATRDVLITPLMVEERLKVANDTLEYPGAEERYRLSRLPGNYPAAQSAVLLKGGLGAYADAVIGGRLLRTVTTVSSIINLAGGFVGIALMFLLTWLGAIAAVTAMNMLLFALVWALPTIVLTSWLGRY